VGYVASTKSAAGKPCRHQPSEGVSRFASCGFASRGTTRNRVRGMKVILVFLAYGLGIGGVFAVLGVVDLSSPSSGRGQSASHSPRSAEFLDRGDPIMASPLTPRGNEDLIHGVQIGRSGADVLARVGAPSSRAGRSGTSVPSRARWPDERRSGLAVELGEPHCGGCAQGRFRNR
jgi:hypothetical protein